MATYNRFTRNIFKAFSLIGITAFAMACGGSDTTSTSTTAPAAVEGMPEASAPVAGLITATDITLGNIDQGRVTKGKEIYDVKCQACHSLGTNRVVGPGWKGVVDQRKPEWIMNMILHTQWMIENDPAAQALVEETKTVMPDQELNKDQARAMLELMRTL